MPKTTGWIAALAAHTTADNREIEDTIIDELGETYDPKFYAARINLQHIRWYGSFGDVLETKVAKENGLKKLFVKIKANELLERINAMDQAVYLSVEFIRNFAQTGKAYLVGLALTDNPASVGTGRVSLSFNNDEQDVEIVTTELFSLKKEEEKKVGLISQVIQSINLKTKEDDMSKEIVDMESFKKLEEENQTLKDKLAKNEETEISNSEAVAKLTQELSDLKTEFNEFKTTLEKTVEDFSRPVATGGESSDNNNDDII